MSRKRSQARARCGRKVAHPTLQAARAAAARLAVARALAGNPIVTFLGAYRCRCGKWHVGGTGRIDWDRVK